MRIWTAHTRAGEAPVLVREGFSWGAFVFGPFWLLAARAWVAGIVALLIALLLPLLPVAVRAPVGLACAVAAGLFGRDLWRWSLDRRGYVMAHVVAARDEDEALARLIDRRPDLIQAALR